MREGLVKLALASMVLLVACADQAAQTPALQPGPSCSPTPATTEGPYFKAGSPERVMLREPGVVGVPLDLSGFVKNVGCQPLQGVTLDFWQADGNGTYDNHGYTLRGHQTVGGEFEYRLQTVVPGLYPGRTEHIHVKVAAPGRPVLTTQLFFPSVAENDFDSIYNPALVIRLSEGPTGKVGSFDFVVG
jgi:protocatechuate 3,4-dioxygenase beta subunit